MKYLFLIIAIIITTVITLMMFVGETKEKNIHPLTNSWEKVVPHQEIPEGLASMSAQYCGACHEKHYEEWKLSTHSHAWTDLQFQAEIKKESSPFMCINCHVPLENQQEYIIEGLVDGDIFQPVKKKNPNFDKDLQQEGITCVACHLRDNTIIGTIGSKNAPHPVKKDVEFLSETLCISCHNAVAVITPTLACSFETGDEWKAGPYFGKQNCISCHMEVTEREIVHGYGIKTNHLHYFEGSGIPKFDTVETKIKNGLAFYPSKPKKKYSINETIEYSLRLKNEFAGHKVPTGDPERYIIISLEIKNQNGDIVATKMERIGEHWQWHPFVRKIGDNNLLPLEERSYSIDYKSEQKEKLSLFVVVTKHRMNEEAAAYNKLGDEYPRFITIFEEVYEMEVL